MKRRIAVTIAVLLMAVVVVSSVTVYAKQKKNQQASIELNFRSEELHVMNDGADLYGEMYLPVEEKEKYPTVILCHGLGSNANAVGHHAKYFATNGFAAYIFDVNHGGVGCRSGAADADMTQLSPLTACDDLNAVIDELKTLPYVDTENLFLGGVSMGGLMAAYVAGERPDEIKGVILQCPAFNISEEYNEQYGSYEELPETIDVRGMILGRQFIIDAMEMDVYNVAPNFRNAVLICHGDKDDLVDISYVQKAADKYENVTLSVYEGADHSFAGQYKLQSEKEELEFLLAHVD